MSKIDEPKQWAIKQHIKKNPKCEWLCTHTKLENLGEQPQIDEPNLDKELDEIIKRDAIALCCNKCDGGGYDYDNTKNCDNCNGTGLTEWQNEYLIKQIKALIATQVQEAEKQGALNALTQLKVDYMNEWVGIDTKTMGLKTAPLTYQAIIEDRIAQLRSTPNEDMDN